MAHEDEGISHGDGLLGMPLKEITGILIKGEKTWFSDIRDLCTTLGDGELIGIDFWYYGDIGQTVHISIPIDSLLAVRSVK